MSMCLLPLSLCQVTPAGDVAPLGEEQKREMLESFGTKALRTLALAYKCVWAALTFPGLRLRLLLMAV